jgi:hypothetical protein
MNTRRVFLTIAFLGCSAVLALARDELSRTWTSSRAPVWERADVVNRAFTNGTPMTIVVAALGTNYTPCFSSARVWLGPGPEPPNTPWLSYRFGEDEVTIHTSATISEGPTKGKFTGAGYSVAQRTPKQRLHDIWSAKDESAKDRCAAVNACFTNGTPMSEVEAVLGRQDTMIVTTTFSDHPNRRVWVYRFGLEEVLIDSIGGPMTPLGDRGFAGAWVGRNSLGQPAAGETNQTPTGAGSRHSP